MFRLANNLTIHLLVAIMQRDLPENVFRDDDDQVYSVYNPNRLDYK